ncbi:MAG: PKD domain-containing protein [Candidatus Paceibacterota bacterium]
MKNVYTAFWSLSLLLSLVGVSAMVAYAAPQANFYADPPSAEVGEEVQFISTSSYDPGTSPEAWTWYVDGDKDNTWGGRDEEYSIFPYTFSSPGNHPVTLIVLDSEGETHSITQAIKVQQALNVDFTFDPENPQAGEVISFEEDISYFGDTSDFRFQWQFDTEGSVQYGSGRSEQHAFSNPGEYGVKLLVTSLEDDRAAETTKTIVVGSKSTDSSGAGVTDIDTPKYDVNTDYGKGGLVPCNGIDCDFNSFIELLNRVIEWIFYTAAVVATVMFAYAGWLYMSSGGSPQKISTAHNIFKKTAIGLIIIALAWLIVNTITASLLDTENGFWTILG